MGRQGLAALLAGCALLAVPSPALAATFYVDDNAGSSTTCGPGAAKCNLISEGLTRARATPEADTIVVDPGLYTQTVDLTNAADAGLTIAGSGSGGGAFDPASQTIVRATSSSANALVRSTQDDVVVRGLRLDVPAPFARPGLDLGGNRNRAEDVLIELGWPDSAAVGVNAPATKAGVVLDRVRVFTPGPSRGVLAYASDMQILDSRVASGQQAVELLGPRLRIARSHLSRAGSGAVVFGGAADLTIDSSLLTGGGSGLELYAASTAALHATLRGVTIDAGEPKVADAGLASLRARADTDAGGTGTAAITAQSSILVEGQASEGSGVGQISCVASDAPHQVESSGADFVSCPSNGAGNSSSTPAQLFAPGVDWHILPGSPAVDAGFDGALAGGESATDLDGNQRVLDGNLDCGARRDKGAYELTGHAAPCPAANPAPVVRRFSMTNSVFRVGGRRSRKSAPRGTRFRWRLSETAAVTIAVELKSSGRRVGGRCRKQTRTNRTRRRCTLFLARGRLSARGRAGANSKAFAGRLRGKALAPGRYRATLIATDAQGARSAPARVAFRVVRR